MVTTGTLVGQFPDDKDYKGGRRDHRKGDDHVRPEPVVLLAAVEHPFQAAEGKRDQRDADPIDAQAAGEALAALAFERFRLYDEPLDQDERTIPIGTLMKKIQCQE